MRLRHINGLEEEMKRQLSDVTLAVREEPSLGQLPAGENPADSLTPREREFLSLVAYGETNKEIARILNISEQTAATHVRNILSKLEAKNRGQAARLWWERTGRRQNT